MFQPIIKPSVQIFWDRSCVHFSHFSSVGVKHPVQCAHVQDAREILYQALRCPGISFGAAAFVSWLFLYRCHHHVLLQVSSTVYFHNMIVLSISLNMILIQQWFGVIIDYRNFSYSLILPAFSPWLSNLPIACAFSRPQAMSVAEDGTIDTCPVVSWCNFVVGVFWGMIQVELWNTLVDS